ncbi:hypothetical protein [Thioalkalivibrio denitrificans]|uniref:hypothetical protein n=1 Tax=Thioalkalivibrio denitrificans TaxID=108003 RepID=UPI0011155586|nr:hypothetical protein [Thioalkalivibrio denitrificans]
MTSRRTPTPFHIFALVALAALLTAACGGNGNAESTAAEGGIPTAADRGLELPDGLASVLPVPEGLNPGSVQHYDPEITFTVRLSDTLREVHEDFTQGITEHGWEVMHADPLPEADEGEVGVGYRLEGHGVQVSISFTVFGGTDSSFNGRGSYIITPQ